jgi:hypothetical protein
MRQYARPCERLLVEQLERRLLLTAEIEPNDSAAAATPFPAVNGSLTGAISTAADVDYFQTTLAHGQSLRIRIGGSEDLRIGPGAQFIDTSGNVLAASSDGRVMTVIAPFAGTFLICLSSPQVFGPFTGSYEINLLAPTYLGATEVEPNDGPSTATAVGARSAFRGALSSGADVDYFGFNATAGQAVAVMFADHRAANPAVSLYDPAGGLVVAEADGLAFHQSLSATGRYTLAVRPRVGALARPSGQYLGGLVVASDPLTEVEPVNDLSTAAPVWNVGPIGARAVGTLSSPDDVDVFQVTLSEANTYEFYSESPFPNTAVWSNSGAQNRLLRIHNSLGHVVRYSVYDAYIDTEFQGVLPAGRYYVSIQAADGAAGLGGYSLYGIAQPRPAKRDVPVFSFDFSGQRAHLGLGPSPFNRPEVIPQLVGHFDADYDIYDVDVTLVDPGTGSEAARIGVGDFPTAVGGRGGGQFGNRQIGGDSYYPIRNASSWTKESQSYAESGPIRHELGHVSDLAHPRHPLTFMGNNRWANQHIVGSIFAEGSSFFVPAPFTVNYRSHLDWYLQAGRLGAEAEPNPRGAPQDLGAWLVEMTADANPRNDRLAVTGTVGGPGDDVDAFTFPAAAGRTYHLDVDAAEFQSPLDAALAVYDPAGSLVATNAEAIDHDSGLDSVDPYLTITATATGAYTVVVAEERNTAGHYRLKVTPATALEPDPPRVLGTFPAGGDAVTATRQLMFYLDHKLDPSMLTATNVRVVGAATGVRAGVSYFDPTDTTLVWRADTPLPPDTFTVTLRGGPGGITDLRGNALDGEDPGGTPPLVWPEVSGDGSPGGDFVTSFSVSGPDTVPVQLGTLSYERHGANRGLFVFTHYGDLDIIDLHRNPPTLRGAGGDGSFGTSDDTFAALDVFFDKHPRYVQGVLFHQLLLWTRGVPDAGSYRVEGSFLDAAGNTVNISRDVTVAVDPSFHGPSVADVSVQPSSVREEAPATIDVTFSGSLDVASLTPTSFRLRRSPDATFFDANDVYVADADNVIEWDAVHHRATFRPATPLLDGHYLIELDGDASGIRDRRGSLLDGEYLDSAVQGNTLFSHWTDTPSGDGIPGGDYLAQFSVYTGQPPAPPEVRVQRVGQGEIASGQTTPVDFGQVAQGTPAPQVTFSVFNDGEETLVLVAPPALPPGFSIGDDGLASSIVGGGSDTFTIRLDTALAGTHSGQISFATNDSDENPFNFPVTGTVTAAAVTADVVDVAPDPHAAPRDPIQITFSEPVNGLDLNDLRLTRNGQDVPLASARLEASSDRRTWTLRNLIGLTSANGTYRLTVVAAASGIVGDSGAPLGSDASDQWTVQYTLRNDVAYVSDLSPVSETSGYRNHNKDASIAFETLKLNGQVFAKGLGAHATSRIVYDLGGKYDRFQAYVGIDDEAASSAQVSFQVWVDGVNVFDSLAMNVNTPTKRVDVPVAGKSLLELVVKDTNSSLNDDHADWADALLTLAPPVVTAVSFDDGSAQRSMIRSLTVTFAQPVFFDADPFILTGRDGAGATVMMSLPENLNRDGRTFVVTFFGTGVVAGSLPDGVYDLTVIASRVHAGLRPEPKPSGPTMVGDYRTTFHRLFGDINGSKNVNAADFNAFRGAFGKSAGQAGYDAGFDFDDSGTVNAADYNAFRSRFGRNLVY